MKKIVMYVKDKDDYIEDLLNYMKELANNGYKFNIDINIENQENHKYFYIDGGGRAGIRDLTIEDGWT